MCTKNLSADNIGSALSGVLNSILKKDIIATPVESTKDKLTFAETPILEVVGKDLGIAQQILPGIIAGLGTATPVNEWAKVQSTPAHWCTSHAVAMAEFNGKLFMAGKGTDGDERIWYSWYDGEKWQEPMAGPGWTSCGVALAVHAGKLFMAWKGMGNDQDIWFSYYDGTNWKPQVRALDTNNYSLSTTHRPALASYKNILYLFCKGSNNDTSIWSSTLQLNNSDFNLSKWAIATRVTYLDGVQKYVGTSHSPAVAVFNNLLGMAWKGIVGDDRIFYSVFDGTKWVPQIPIPCVSTSCGPSLAPYAKFWMHTKSFDPIARDLYGVWKGSKDNKGADDPKIYQSAFQLFKDPLAQDNNGFLPQKLTSENFKTSDTPALAVFNNRLYMAWKNATNNRIYFSYLETGSDKRVGNIFDETRKGVPVLRPDDLLALRIETKNLKAVTSVTTNNTIPKAAANPNMPKKIGNAKIAFLTNVDKLREITTNTVINNELEDTLGNPFTQRDDVVVTIVNPLTKIKELGVGVIFCQNKIDEASQEILAKEGIMAIHEVPPDEMKKLAFDTGATIKSRITYLTSKDFGYARSVEEKKMLKFTSLILTGCESKAQLQKIGTDPAYIILHFPPQSFAEQTFYATPQEDYKDVDKIKRESFQNDEDWIKAQKAFLKSEKLMTDEQIKEYQPKPIDKVDAAPPIRARIARESRLVFIVPDGKKIAYSLEGVLGVCQELDMKVANAAKWRPKSDSSKGLKNSLGWDISLVDRIKARTLKTEEVVQDSLKIKETISDVRKIFKSVKNNPEIYSVLQSSALLSMAEKNGNLTELQNPNLTQYPSKVKPQPELPDDTTTSIEMPWRLIISPHDKEYWRHATKPITGTTNHTELWHTRLVSEAEIEPSYPDEDRTIRAIWALSGTGAEMANNGKLDNPQPVLMSGNDLVLPSPALPIPFLTTLDNFDRYQIAHLSSNFNISGYEPEAIDTKAVMLSALGGWLDSRGEWEPPAGLSVEEWTHRATMGRDHFVRVVYKGFLFPFGHRAALIKVSERKFHPNKSPNEGIPDGNPAYLRQRMFLVVREKERTYDEKGFINPTKEDNLRRKFPFKSVRILTQTTPDLDNPTSHTVKTEHGQKMFWPHLGANKPFRFQCAATDIEDQEVLFDLPMIFVDNTLASPADPDRFNKAIGFANEAKEAFTNKGETYNTADLNYKPVALAPCDKTGDTNVQVEKMSFGGFTNISLQDYSQNLTRPIWVPQVVEVKARIEAIAHLSGSKETNILTYNETYLKEGFHDTINKGQVFVNVSGDAGLNFSSQGDKSGGFIQPNLIPIALSRLTGPVTGSLEKNIDTGEYDLDNFIKGKMVEGGGFPKTTSGGVPLPLLFGCISLSDIIAGASVLGSGVPKFISEAGTKMDSFLNGIQRLVDLVTDFPALPARIAKGALELFKDTFEDLKEQALAYAPSQVGEVVKEIEIIKSKIDKIISLLKKATEENIFNSSYPDFETILSKYIPENISVADINKLIIKADKSIPDGFCQSIRTATNKLTTLLNQINLILTIIPLGKTVYKSGDELLKEIEKIPGSDNVNETIQTISEKIGSFKDAIEKFSEELKKAVLLEGAPLNTLNTALKFVIDILGNTNDFLKLIEMLTGDELTVRFDWNPEIKSWGLTEDHTKKKNQLFRVNDPKGLLVAVEAKVKKNGASSPNMSVNCSLKNFDLVLIAPASFIELNFEKVEFMIDSGAKPNVDVKLHGIKFVGPLSFVETLRDLIPLDGFSDPPYLDITAKGIDAGFSVSLPTICIGVLNIANISLGAGFTVPFIGEPLSVRFNFCTRQQPFMLTVYGLGGGGFFGLAISPNGVQMLEAAFEFGAAISVNFGVASGGVHVMAGIYYRMEESKASLTGYFRLGGYVSVLGLITASLELYLGLTYNFTTGKCVGIAKLTIEVSVLFFSTSVTITCERQFAGANGDPTIRQMLGPTLEELKQSEGTVISLEDEISLIKEETEYAWREYFDAFVL